MLEQFADNDPTRFHTMPVRFAKHVFPGETIRTEMWQVAEDKIVFQSKVVERVEVKPRKEVYPGSHEGCPYRTVMFSRGFMWPFVQLRP